MEYDERIRMNEKNSLLKRLSREKKEYLETYFASAPQWLLEEFQVVRIPQNTIFVQEGSRADHVYILIQGKVLAVDYRVQEIAYGFLDFEPVEAFGTMEILGDIETYRTTLTTVEDSTLLRMSRDKFEKWLRSDRTAFQMEVKKVVRYMLKQDRKERLYVLLSGMERVCLVLYRMYESRERNGPCSVYISRKAFSETTGLSERTITRILKNMEQRGCISREGWNIRMTQEQYELIRSVIEDKINEMGE